MSLPQLHLSGPAALLTLVLLAGCGQAPHPHTTATPEVKDPMMGHWDVRLLGGDGITYLGTLTVSQRTGEGLYKGDLLMQFSAAGNRTSTVEEDAEITVSGDTVMVICKKPVVLTEDTDYLPDNFLVTHSGPGELKGIEKDVEAIGGTVTMTKVAR